MDFEFSSSSSRYLVHKYSIVGTCWPGDEADFSNYNQSNGHSGLHGINGFKDILHRLRIHNRIRIPDGVGRMEDHRKAPQSAAELVHLDGVVRDSCKPCYSYLCLPFP